MQHSALRLSWLLLLASCFTDSGGESTGTSTTSGTSTTPNLTDATSSGPTPTGTSTDAATGSTTGTSSETTDPTGGLTGCPLYCEFYMSACHDSTEYSNDAACLAQCAQWPVGMVDATDGDSLGCRQYHVSVALEDPATHCPHAGPSGAGVCVAEGAPTCAAYCATYLANCQEVSAYIDAADCQTQCAGWYPGFAGQTAGDSIGCREYHAGVALGDPAIHCPHAGPTGANVCVAVPP